MGFNLGFKGLISLDSVLIITQDILTIALGDGISPNVEMEMR